MSESNEPAVDEIEVQIIQRELEVENSSDGGERSVVSLIYVQKMEANCTEKAIEFLDTIFESNKEITKFRMNVEVSDTTAAERILLKFMNTENVKLEELRVKRRYVGQKFPTLIELIKAHASTLRVVRRLGLDEAIQAFHNTNVRLEHLSLINFDLVENGEMQSESLTSKSQSAMRRMAGLGAVFEHLSYTTYGGFEITQAHALRMLRMCKVRSLRVTQQNGVVIKDPPFIRPLLTELKRIVLVGGMEVNSKHLDRLFPNLESFVFHEEELLHGGVYTPGNDGARKSSRRQSIWLTV